MEVRTEIRESVTFENCGQKIFGVLHRPHVDLPSPAIIIFHGFASHKVGRNRAYVKLSEALTRQGIAVLRFDFRGAGDSEGELSEMTIEGLISDGKTAISFLKNQPTILPEKIGILGSSLGGAIAVYAAASSNIAALCLWAPVASGEIWYRDWIQKYPSKKPLTEHHGVSLSEIFREQFSLLSADQEIEKLANVPLLHLHGDRDDIISLNHRLSYQEHRQNAHAESRFVMVEDTDHSLGFSPRFPQVLKETTDWFKKYL